jgi:exosortase/archaeosortase family protein
LCRRSCLLMPSALRPQTMLNCNRYRAWYRPLLSRGGRCRVALSIALLLAFPLLDWLPIRELVARVSSRLLSVLGAPSHSVGARVFIGHLCFHITPRCTVLDLLFASAPFWWWYRTPWFGLAVCFPLFCAVVSVVNLMRISLASLAFAWGAPWFWVHHVPHLLVWLLAFALSVLAWSASHPFWPCQRSSAERK